MHKWWKIFGIVIILILLVILIVYNINNNYSFFEVSLSSFLTLFTAIFISFYLVQKNTDQRYQKQIYCNLLSDIQKIVTDPATYIFNKNTDTKEITTRKRTLSNYLRLVDAHSGRFGLEKEVNFIFDKFKEYEDLIGNHLTDISYLEKSKEELQRPLDLINSKLYEMMLKLYN